MSSAGTTSSRGTDLTAQNIYGLLIRSRLLALDQVRALYDRWQVEARGDVANGARFAQWLVANGVVTEYQAGLLARGHADVFFLGPYKILERIGRGRMAGVYKAVHTLGQTVAIKVLPPSRARDAHMLARFQREARLALRLKHPNIVRAFQMGEHNGLHYFVMEYLEGETLEEVLQRRKRLSPVEAVRLVHHALLGLQHLHEQGMIHRDLKPANMMLTPPARPGQADTTLHATLKILDIGLGRELYDETAPAKDIDQLTSEGALLGTPDYMSPEQARDARSIDIRADIYSLGCVLYHLLAGQAPFPDTNIINQMIRHATETAKPLQEFDPAIPDVLQQVVSWMMAKDPAQRYQTPQRAAQALRIFLHSELASPRGGEAEVRTPEAEPGMVPYLNWLEAENAAHPPPASDPVVPAAPAPVPPAPPAPPPPPPAPPEPSLSKSGRAIPSKPESRPSAPERDAGQRAKDRPRKSRSRTTQFPAPSSGTVPVAVPAESLDVELVPAPAPGQRPPSSSGEEFLLTRRDYLMMAIGGSGVGLALFLGWLLAQLFRRKGRDPEATPEPERLEPKPEPE